MADYKISQLNFADKIYDHDLMVVVTGYATEGSYPDNCKISLDRIRKDIIRLNEMIFFLSGFSGYYNSGENTYTITSHHRMGNLIELDYDDVTPHMQIISTTGINLRTENLLVRDHENTWPYSGILYNTGLNAVVGNNIEIQFLSGTPASNIYGRTEGKYKSGIISTTGLNAVTENLIVRDFQNTWPYSGVIYSTGLNARVGNNIEIQFSAGTPAANKYGGVQGKYKSGIISTVGLNARTENLIVRNFENTWPYSGIIYNTGLNARAGNNIEIDFSTNRHLNMGSPYYSGTISTTGLNMIASTGIQYSISNTWPYPYIVSQLDLKVVANDVFTYGPTTSTISVEDNRLYRDIDWSLSNSKPLIDNSSSYCYIVELFLNNLTLSTVSVPSPESQGRPTTASNGSGISWGICTTTISPATVTVAMSGNNIINTDPSSNPTYNASNSGIYLRYIEKRNLNSTARVQPRYTIDPASYSRSCTGTYQVWVPDPGYSYTASISWNDGGDLDTTLSLGSYRHLKLDFAELNSTSPAAPTTTTTAAPTTTTTTTTTEAPGIFYLNLAGYNSGSIKRMSIFNTTDGHVDYGSNGVKFKIGDTIVISSSSVPANPDGGFRDFIGTYEITDLLDDRSNGGYRYTFELNCVSAHFGCSIWNRGNNWTQTGPPGLVTITSNDGAVLSSS